MALSSSSSQEAELERQGEVGVLGLKEKRWSRGETGETSNISPLRFLQAGCWRGGVASAISSFLMLCLLSWSLKAGLRGPMSADTDLREGRAGTVAGCLVSGVAPVSFWTSARKVDGSACTKVVWAGLDPWSDGEDLLVAIIIKRERERESRAFSVCIYLLDLRGGGVWILYRGLSQGEGLDGLRDYGELVIRCGAQGPLQCNLLSYFPFECSPEFSDAKLWVSEVMM